MDNQFIFKVMMNSLISKYGLLINTKNCALILGIGYRTLDERRKSGVDCPEYIEEKKFILYPVQNIVEYQLEKTKHSVKIMQKPH